MLNERKHLILCAAVEDYIASALPITSGDVKEKHIKDISSATLRNELNALEAMGYLKQLHTSSGRIPTAEGYKYYVNNLLKTQKFDKTKLCGVKQIVKSRTESITEIINEISRVVAKETSLPTVVYYSGYQKLVVDAISIIPLIGSELLLLLKTKDGVVNSTIKASATAKACEDAGYFLTKKYAGYTIGSLKDSISKDLAKFSSELSGFESIVSSMIDVLEDLIGNGTINICSQGSAKLLENSKTNFDSAKNLIGMLEDESALKEAVATEDDDSISVEIGESGGNPDGCATVKAPIKIGGKIVGSVGVLGLERMDYASIASVLKYVMDEMNNIKLDYNSEEVSNGEKR